MIRWIWHRWLYRPTMRLLHRFHLHYMPLSYPDGDVVAWCHWCGARSVIRRRQMPPSSSVGTGTVPVQIDICRDRTP